MKNLPKNYDHQKTEKYWQEQWVERGTYHFHDDMPREQTFVIDTPPPTVSGVLHMGHIFSYTQADFIARYQRMAGKDVFYPMGFDDNGLPTERLVEKAKNVRGSAMPRADFVALCREVVKDAEEEFRTLFKSAALSVDWRQEYQTISDDVRKLSQESFLDLLKKGEAYRDFRPTYWDWVDQTAIAQAEIENKEMPGVMNYIKFARCDVTATLDADKKIKNVWTDESDIEVMTTRPELLGACVAVLYHPDDEKASMYAGTCAITPVFGIRVPMIADEAVEREKGTGLVMCCTFGDDTDKEWVNKYQFPVRPILSKDGRVAVNIADTITFYAGKNGKYLPAELSTDNAVDLEKSKQAFKEIFGLKPKQANAKVIELLQNEGKLLKQTPIIHTVKCAERSGTPIEIIPTYQWFVKVTDKKEALLKKGAEVKWYPEYMQIRLNQWIEGLKEDWCISRQRFFGVPFPVWYSKRAGEEGKIIFADVSQLPIDPMVDLPKGYTRDEVTADVDVLDTWATSSISPQINARAIKLSSCGLQSSSTGSSTNEKDPAQSLRASQDDRYKKLFPADLRPQAHEIIRTWAFYTIVKSYLHTRHSDENRNPESEKLDTDVRRYDGEVPWKNIAISGWCLAADKTKMSKSKGNVVTPVALIEEKGTDSVRYWASTSRLGTDTAFSEELLKIGRKLVNKLWNASQFASINLDKLKGTPTTAAKDSAIIREALDQWIISRLHVCVTKATKAFEEFEYCDARVAIEDFFWNDFCDNYLELVKARAYGENGGNQQSALYAIYHCLDAILRLFAPFVPHITEELYSHIFDDRFAKFGSVHARGQWPVASDYPYFANAEKSGMAAVDILNVIRKSKSEANVSIKVPVEEVLVFSTADVSWKDVINILDDLKAAGNAVAIKEAKNDGTISERGWFQVSVKLASSA